MFLKEQTFYVSRVRSVSKYSFTQPIDINDKSRPIQILMILNSLCAPKFVVRLKLNPMWFIKPRRKFFSCLNGALSRQKDSRDLL